MLRRAIVTAQGTQATVNAIHQASPAVITTSMHTTLAQMIKLLSAGIGGMVELNTGVRYYVKVLNTTDPFEIYADEDFVTPN